MYGDFTPSYPTEDLDDYFVRDVFYLEQSIQDGKARNLADAIDLAVEQLMVYENRERLANDTTPLISRR